MNGKWVDTIIILICITIGYSFHYISMPNTTPTSPTTIQIEGKTNYSLGDLADFSAVINNKGVNFVSDWKVLKNNQSLYFKEIGDNNIIFPVGVEKCNIQLIFSGSYIDPSTKRVQNTGIIVKNIVVGSNPDPNPNPNPDPSPVVIPDGKYKIAQKVYTTAVSLVHSNKLADAAKSLSESYNLVSKKIDDGKYLSLQDVYIDLKTNNDQALNKIGEDPNNWKSWDEVIRKEISSLHTNKKLTMPDHSDLLKEIATGLSFVK